MFIAKFSMQVGMLEKYKDSSVRLDSCVMFTHQIYMLVCTN